MKKTLLILLLLPSLCSAQHWEIAEMAGCSFGMSGSYMELPYYGNSGFSNQLSVGYYFTKHFSIDAIYENNTWYAADNNFGLSPNIHFWHLYAGADISEAYVSSWEAGGISCTYKPSILYGLHLGIKQKITKHISLKGQIGYTKGMLSGSLSEIALYPSPVLSAYHYEYETFSANFPYIRALIGISYSINKI